MKIRKGIELLSEISGNGPEVKRGGWYEISIRMWLNKGDPIKWDRPFGIIKNIKIEENKELLTTRIRMDRENLIPGLFYGIEGMKIGGKRKIKIAPHMAYREEGLPGMIPENALIISEISINTLLNNWDDP